MSALPTRGLITVADYLAGELDSPVKHEYLGGYVYVMAGGKNRHNLIASNLTGMLYTRLRGKPCRAYNSDTKVRVQSPTHTRFYYPDASIVCNPNPPDDTFHDRPVIIVEVLSDATRRTDEGEKLDAYLTIPSLMVYLIVDPERPVIVVYRRGEQGFAREVVQGLDAELPLDEVGLHLPLAEVYDGVEQVH